MRRTGAVLAAAAFAAVSLVGCSGGGDKAYCDQVKAAQTSMEGALKGASDPKELSEGLSKAKAEVDKIAAVAPADVKDEWDSVAGAFEKVAPALDQLKDIDLKNPDPAKMEELQKLGKDMEGLGKQMEKAGDTIQKDAKERCNIDLK